MHWRLEVVFVPVSDVDRAKAFYRDQVGFNEDFDSRFGDDVRMVQLTPPGSGCSIGLLTGLAPGPGLKSMEPGIAQWSSGRCLRHHRGEGETHRERRGCQ